MLKTPSFRPEKNRSIFLMMDDLENFKANKNNTKNNIFLNLTNVIVDPYFTI